MEINALRSKGAQWCILIVPSFSHFTYVPPFSDGTLITISMH